MSNLQSPKNMKSLVEYLLKKNGKTKIQLAELIGIKRQWLDVKLLKNQFTDQELEQLAGFVNVDLSTFLKEDSFIESSNNQNENPEYLMTVLAQMEQKFKMFEEKYEALLKQKESTIEKYEKVIDNQSQTINWFIKNQDKEKANFNGPTIMREGLIMSLYPKRSRLAVNE